LVHTPEVPGLLGAKSGLERKESDERREVGSSLLKRDQRPAQRRFPVQHHSQEAQSLKYYPQLPPHIVEDGAMRLGRVRFTIRRMMVVVAGAGIILGASVVLQRRHARFSELAVHHEASSQLRFIAQGEVGGSHSSRLLNGLGEELSGLSNARVEWHRRLGVKYRRAARSPWLPVEPDPPEPEP
jgi:hypothetical protein